LLGGRVEVDTPSGPMRLVIPPCTSSGAVLRLKRRARGDEPQPAAIYLEVQIVMPPSLDEQSRALVLEFARLNPYDPRA
jgi:DnaJ-class molecular chaperone